MNKNHFWDLLHRTLDDYRTVIPYRNDSLFTEFLPRGYEMTTLSSVAQEHFQRIQFIKCNLGMFITLIDDFADNPELRNKQLLEKLYRVPFDDEFIDLGLCTEAERKICDLALMIRGNMKTHIRELPGFLHFYDIFKFDFEEIMRSNQYSELITDCPEITNPLECTHYGAYNMGMVLAGMIDLMSTPKLNDPLGVLRHTFLRGQRYSRLSNLITTLDRERSENDKTNEIVALSQYYGTSIEEQEQRARAEMTEIIEALKQVKINHFDIGNYVSGLEKLFDLHISMTSKI
jgi:hypothetical protein